MDAESKYPLVGVDWLTVTTPLEKIGLYWYTQFLDWAKSPEFSRSDTIEWRNRWYVGRRCGGVSWGYSKTQGYILISSGAVANEWYKRVFVRPASCTRVDLQVTVDLGEHSTSDLVTRHWNKNKSRKPSLTAFHNSEGGATLYVGSRHSDQFGRLYDKGVKSYGAEKNRIWRYEVEVRKPRSSVLIDSMLRESAEKGVNTQALASFVWNWFSERGITPRFSPSSSSNFTTEVGKRVSSAEKSLAWFRTQVRPTFLRLVQEGRGQDVVKSLGIDEDLYNQLGLVLQDV